MAITMTDEQKDLFIAAAQMGMACGLAHPWEWLMNSLRQTWMPYAQRSEMEERFMQAFVAFWHGCGSGPDDPCENATIEHLYQEIERYYAQPNPIKQRDQLRKALLDILGADDTREGLRAMELGVRLMPAPESDKIAALNGIHALLTTLQEPAQ